MRIVFFLLTNLSIITLFGIALSSTGMQSSSIQNLLITTLLFGFGGSFFSLFASKWMAIKSVGGEIIEHPYNDMEKWLMNTISTQVEMVGIAMPQVAIYPSPDINAFATGSRRNSSVIAVSTGLLQHMKKYEAEAVIAHEISHIVNGDMVTMTLIQGTVNTFVISISRIISRIICEITNGSRKENKEELIGNSFIYSSTRILLELVFGILASLVVMWFSRHREFYADAGSANLVGHDKMIAALQRLKTSFEPLEPKSIITFCINGKQNVMLSELFMTHPPLEKRIEALQKRKYN